MSITLKEMYRYPVKGLTGERLDTVTLSPGRGLPHDRRFAISRGSAAGGGAGDGPGWQSKRAFVTLMQTEKLATVQTRFDDSTGVLTVKRGGRQVVAGAITDPTGRTLVAQFLSAFLGDSLRGVPALVDGGDGADGVRYTDVEAGAVSIINLASVRDLARVVGRPVDPRRFRGNLHIDGAPPWQEWDWVGRNIRVGPVTLKAVDRIERCAATNVDPDRGSRDMNLPLALQRGFRHCDMGLLAEVVDGGDLVPGEAVVVA